MSDLSAERHVQSVGAMSSHLHVNRSKQLVSSATRELQRHEVWLRRHHELYSEALKECQRQLERGNVIGACARTILFPVTLLVSVCAALIKMRWAVTRRAETRAELQRRINTMDRIRSRQLPQAPRHHPRRRG